MVFHFFSLSNGSFIGDILKNWLLFFFCAFKNYLTLFHQKAGMGENVSTGQDPQRTACWLTITAVRHKQLSTTLCQNYRRGENSGPFLPLPFGCYLEGCFYSFPFRIKPIVISGWTAISTIEGDDLRPEVYRCQHLNPSSMPHLLRRSRLHDN